MSAATGTRRRGRSVLALFTGLLANAAGAIATWDRGPESGPHWYPPLLAATALPCGWLGGRLRRPALSGTAAPPPRSAARGRGW